MFQRPPFGGQNPQSDFGFKSNTTGNQFGQNAFGSGFSGTTNPFNTTPFSTNNQSNTGLSFGRGTQPTQQTAFGSTVQPTVFGSTAQTSAFGSGTTQPQTFGSTPSQTSVFGTANTQQQPSGIFGQVMGSGASSGLGGGQQMDAQRQQQGSAFGIGESTPFGQIGSGLGMNKQFGGTSSNVFSSMGGVTTTTDNCGTVNPQYSESVMNEQGSSGPTVIMSHICAKIPYSSWSIEELRWKDYQLNRKPQYNKNRQAGMGMSLGFGMGQLRQPSNVLGSVSGTSSFNIFDRNQQSNRPVSLFDTSANRFGATQQQTGVLDKNLGSGTSTSGIGIFGGLGNRQTTSNQPFTLGGTQNQGIGGFRSTTGTGGSVFGTQQNTLTQPFSAIGSANQATPSLFDSNAAQQNTFQSGFGLTSQGATNQNTSAFGFTQQNPLSQPSQLTSLSSQPLPSLTGQTLGSRPPESQTQSLFGRSTGLDLFGSSGTANKTMVPTFGQSRGPSSLQQSSASNVGPSTFGTSYFGSTPSFGGAQQPSTIMGIQQTPSSSLLGNQSQQMANKPSLFGQPSGTSLFGGSLLNNQAAAPSATPYSTQSLGATTSHMGTFGASAAQSRVFTPSIDKNPYGLFDQNAFPIAKTEKKVLFHDKSSDSTRSDRYSSSKLAEKYFSSIKLGAKARTEARMDSVPLPNIITPRDYARMESESWFSFRRPHHRLLIDGVNTTNIHEDSNSGISSEHIKANNSKSSAELNNLLENIFTNHRADGNNMGALANGQKPSEPPENSRKVRELSHRNKDCEMTKTLDFDDEFILPNGSKEVVYRPKFDPPLTALVNMRDDELMHVKNLKIWADDVGSITFLEGVNIFDLVTDVTVESLWKKFNELVKFMHRVVSVYPLKTKKHPIGKGLNLKAEISLKGCRPNLNPTSKTSSAIDVEYDNHVRTLEKATGTRFKSYDRTTGTWTFTVEHFTTYGFGVNNQEGNSKTGLISDDEPAEQEFRTSPNKIKTEEYSNITKPPYSNGMPNLSHKQRVDPLRADPGTQDHASGKKKMPNGNTAYLDKKDESGISDVVNSGINDASGKPGVKESPSKGEKRHVSALGIDCNSMSHDSSGMRHKAPKIENRNNPPKGYQDSYVRFFKKLNSDLSLKPDQDIPFAKIKSQPSPCISMLNSTQNDYIMRQVDIRRGYASNIGHTTIDLVSSNGRMFGVCWGPHGTLVTLAKSNPSPSKNIIITKINPLEDVTHQTKVDEASMVRLYESMLEKALYGCSTIIRDHPCPDTAALGASPLSKAPLASRQDSSLSSIETSLESTISVSSVSTTVGALPTQKDESNLKPVPRASIECVNFKAFEEIVSTHLPEDSSTSPGYSRLDELIRIFSLSSVLFDPLPESLLLPMRNHKDFAYLCDAIRRDKLSSWLRDTLAFTAKKKLKDVSKPQEKILVLIMSGQIHMAIQVALEEKYYVLVAIMTQLCGAFKLKLLRKHTPGILNRSEVSIVQGTSYGVRGMDDNVSSCIAQQICAWRNCERKAGIKMYSSFIDPGTLDLWCICSGKIALWPSSIFSRIEYWINAFALFFWYGGLCSWDVSQSLKYYDESCEKYSNIETPYKTLGEDREEKPMTDPCYLLLKLFSDTDIDIGTVFDATNYSRNPLDCLVVWLICASLISVVNSKGTQETTTSYTSKLSKDYDYLKEVYYSITHTLAFALEAVGLWKWALYVALFIEDEDERKSLIMLILAHNYPCDDTSGSSFSNLEYRSQRCTASIFGEPQKTPHKDSAIYKFITETLCIPSVWIHEVRSLDAFYENNNLLFTTSQIDSGATLTAYISLAAGIFSDSIISGDTDLTKDLLELLDQRIEIPSVRAGISFLQKSISVIESGEGLKDAKKREISPDALRGLINKWKEDLGSILGAFSKGIFPQNIIGVAPFNGDNVAYHFILDKFSYNYLRRTPYKRELFQELYSTCGKKISGISICLSIIYEKCVDLYFDLRRMYPEHFVSGMDSKTLDSIISFLLPSASDFRIQKLKLVVSNEILSTRAS